MLPSLTETTAAPKDYHHGPITTMAIIILSLRAGGVVEGVRRTYVDTEIIEEVDAE